MLIFRQNRYIALLVGVILVCFSAISLLHPGQVTEAKVNNKQMPKLQSISRASVLSYIQERSTPNQVRLTSAASHKLLKSASLLSPVWTIKGNTKWLDMNTIKQQGTSQASIVRVKSDIVQASPTAQKVTQVDKATTRSQTAVKTVSTSQQHPPTTLYFSRTQLLSQEQQSNATRRYAVSEEELFLLQKIVMAEAEGEPYQGKVAVANVVLNRLRSANFPDTITKVIYQKSQFSPVADGRLKRVSPNDDTINAVNDALSGVKEVPDDTYFFLSLKLAQDLTVHHSQEYVKKIGNHTFYK